MVAFSNHLHNIEGEKLKLRAQVRRLCQENAWLRDELSSTQQRLQADEQRIATLEEEKKQLEFMNDMKKYDADRTPVSDRMLVETCLQNNGISQLIILACSKFIIFTNT